MFEVSPSNKQTFATTRCTIPGPQGALQWGSSGPGPNHPLAALHHLDQPRCHPAKGDIPDAKPRTVRSGDKV